MGNWAEIQAALLGADLGNQIMKDLQECVAASLKELDGGDHTDHAVFLRFADNCVGV
jgi:hypothetical protein